MFAFLLRDRSISSKDESKSLEAIEGTKHRKAAASVLALTFGLFAVLMLTLVGIQYAMHALLIQHAHSTGMDWAHHIEVRTPTLSTIVASDPDSELRTAPSAVEFTKMVNGM